MTLIELLVALAISTMLFVAMSDLIRLTLQMTAQQPLALQAVDQARSAAADFTDELRDATYGSDGSYPLLEASSTEIIFFSPYRSSVGVERFRYFVASSTLYRGVTPPSGSPSQYVSGNEKITALVALATSTTLFTYYTGVYAGATTTPPLSQPVSISNVTYAQISLTVLAKGMRNATTTFTLTSGATIRNVKTNLGE